MSSKAGVHVAVQTALYNDNKRYDPAQIMSSSPFSYNTHDLMRDFVLDVAHELANDTPPQTLNVDSLNLDTCMGDSVKDLESDIYEALP